MATSKFVFDYNQGFKKLQNSFTSLLCSLGSTCPFNMVLCTDKKENQIFLIYKEIQKRAVESHI
jgi:hypothetical protein